MITPSAITSLYKKNPTLSLFLTRLLIIYIAWKGLFFCIWRNYFDLFPLFQKFCMWAIELILHSTAFFLSIFQYKTEVIPSEIKLRILDEFYVDPAYMNWELIAWVSVGEDCIGYGVMALFIALILAYPGNNKIKLWFIPIGLFLIYCFNILRVAILTIIIKYDPAIWELNHKFAFKFVIYGLVFLLWARWLNLIKDKTPKTEPT
ncbi:archaeosortase/exosortase family protein [Aureispira]|nr:archaeosortase/exosortase family protein [Aureispira sp.]